MLDRSGRATAADARISPILPQAASDATLWCLDHVARSMVTLGVSANAVSMGGVVVAAVAGVLLSLGQFGAAAAAMVVASLGDALDGLVARRSGRATVSGGLLDASVDRYGEFFFLGGLAVFFRGSVPVLVTALIALAGSFMISYGSAKAGSLGLPVPPSAMRRAERAVCLCAGAALAVPFAFLARRFALPAWVSVAPPVAALGLVALVANVSAIRRLRCLARAACGASDSMAVRRPPLTPPCHNPDWRR